MGSRLEYAEITHSCTLSKTPTSLRPPPPLHPTICGRMLRSQALKILRTACPRVHAIFLASTPVSLNHHSRPHLTDPPAETTSGLSSEPSASPSSPSPGLKFKEPSGLEDVQSTIRCWSEQHFIELRQRTDSLVARLATSFTRLGGEINRVTGYEEIETLKRQVVSQGRHASLRFRP